MTDTILEVASEVSRDSNWSTYVGGSTDFTNLQLPDDTSTYLLTNDNTGNVRFSLDNLPSNAASVSKMVSSYRILRNQDALTVLARLIDSGGTQDGANVNPTTGYVNYTDTFLTAFGSAPWTVALVNGCDVVCRKSVGGANTDARLTTIFVTATWSAKSGSYSWMIGSWLPPLLAAASHGLSRLDIVHLLSSLKTRPSNDEDFSRILEAFRVRPRYSFL